MVKYLAILGAPLLFASHAVVAENSAIVYASKAGAHLDAELMRGGGTDDTAILQRLLDRAANGHSLHLILDGPALVTGLNVYGNTTIECSAGGGLYLKDGSHRAILRNANRSRGTILDEGIEVRGCFLNGNRAHQGSPKIPPPPSSPVPPFPTKQEPDGTFITGLQFLGVNYLAIDHVTLWNIQTFGALIANARYVTIHDVIVDDGGRPNQDMAEYINTDGLHFKGPLQYVSIDTVKLRVDDDGIAFNPNDGETDDITTRNDFGPYVGQGPITDVTVSNVIFMPGQLQGIRIFSTTERVDRIAIENVVGTVRMNALEISHLDNPKSFGNVGAVSVRDMNVDSNFDIPGLQTTPFIVIDSQIESLNLQGIVTNATAERPVLSIGSKAALGLLSLGFTVKAQAISSPFLELAKDSHIDRLKLGLDWLGNSVDSASQPILNHGGTISHLQWVDTPPLYVEAHRASDDRSSLEVAFTQQLKAHASGRGVKVTVNQRPLAIVGAVLQSDGMTMRYKLASSIKPDDSVTWSYESSEGEIQNLVGISLQSVSEKRVR